MTTAIPVLSLKPSLDCAANADAIVARELLPVLQNLGAFSLSIMACGRGDERRVQIRRTVSSSFRWDNA